MVMADTTWKLKEPADLDNSMADAAAALVWATNLMACNVYASRYMFFGLVHEPAD